MRERVRLPRLPPSPQNPLDTHGNRVYIGGMILAVAKLVPFPEGLQAAFLPIGIFLMALAGLGFVFCAYMIYRNKKVYEWRTKQLGNVELDELLLLLQKRDFESFNRVFEQWQARIDRYESLPSYDYMLVRKFWVWPLDKFGANDDTGRS